MLAALKSTIYRLLRLDTYRAYVESIREHLYTLERFINRRVDDTQQFMHTLSGAHHTTAQRVSRLELQLEQLEKRLEKRVQAISDLMSGGSSAPVLGATAERSVKQFLNQPSARTTGARTTGTRTNSLLGKASLSSTPEVLPEGSRGARVLELGVASLLLANKLRALDVKYSGLSFSPLFVSLANESLIKTSAPETTHDAPPFDFALFGDDSLGRLSRERFDVIFISVDYSNWSTRRVEWLLELASGVLAQSGKLFLSLPISTADQNELGWQSIAVCNRAGLEARNISVEDETVLSEWSRALGGKSTVSAFRPSELS